MAIRVPRGYGVNRPSYQEICEGVRPNIDALPLKAFTGLGAVRVDQLHHDPIVIDAGTIVGLSTGTIGGTAALEPHSGTLLPAMYSGLSHVSGGVDSTWTGLVGMGTLEIWHHSDGASWGLPTDSSVPILFGNVRVKPLGVVYQPIYSFRLNDKFTNYKRTESVGVITDYVIQIPAITLEEHDIRAGDLVCVGSGQKQGNLTAARAYGAKSSTGRDLGGMAGRFKRYTGEPALAEWVVGRCLNRFLLGTSTTANERLSDALDNSRFTVSSVATSQWKGLDKVQTVPGAGNLSGSGTKGVPAWFLDGVGGGSGGLEYVGLTLLIRL